MKNKIFLIFLYFLIFLIFLYITSPIPNFLYLIPATENTVKNQYKIKKKLNSQPEAKGILTTSLFGDLNNSKYIDPLIKKDIYIPPGWTFRIYLTPEASENLINKLLSLNYEIYIMEIPSQGLSGTLWRFLPLTENKPFICLDADEIGKKPDFYSQYFNKKVYDKWKASNKPFVFFSKSGILSPIIGGRWGANYYYPNLVQEIEKYDNSIYGKDEVFLRNYIYPIAKREGYIKL
jgi:hypothetical protein